jgi:hypothetical protein
MNGKSKKQKLDADGLTKVVASLCQDNGIPFVICLAKDGPDSTRCAAVIGPVSDLVFELEVLKTCIIDKSTGKTS